MNFFIQSIITATLIKKDALGSNPDDMKYYFDITLPDEVFYKNLSIEFQSKKMTALLFSFSEIKNANYKGVQLINDVFSKANQKLLNEIFIGGEGGNIDEIKKRIYDEEIQKLSAAVNEKASNVNDGKKLLTEDLITNTTSLINSFTNDLKDLIIPELNNEFKNYIDKLTNMKESGNIEIIVVDKTTILEIIFDKFNYLTPQIKDTLSETSNKLSILLQGSCQEEDVKTRTIMESGNKKLREEVTNAITATIVDNYEEIIKATKDTVALEISTGFDNLNVLLNEVPPIFKSFLIKLGDFILAEQKTQLTSIEKILKENNDIIVEDMMS